MVALRLTLGMAAGALALFFCMSLWQHHMDDVIGSGLTTFVVIISYLLAESDIYN